MELARAMGERLAVPGLEHRLMRREMAAAREPGPVQPVDRARLELEGAGDRYLRHRHRREADHRDAVTDGRPLGHDEPDVVAAALRRHHVGAVPLVAEPLAVGEPALACPRHEPRVRGEHVVALVGPRDAEVRDAPRGQLEHPDLEAVGVVSGGQPREAMAVLAARHEARTPVTGVRGHVERPRGHAVPRLERAREVRARREPALERDVGEAELLRPRHEENGALEPQSRHEPLQRLSHHRPEDPVEMVRGEARDPGDLVELQRPGQMARHVVDGAVDPLDVVDGRRARNRKI